MTVVAGAAVGAGAVLDAGGAWFEAGDRDPAGTVCGVFRRAAYLRFGDRILALCRADVAPGPLHLRLATFAPLTVGDPAEFDGHHLQVGSVAVAVSTARRWAPEPVDAEALRRRAADRWGRAGPDPGPFASGVGLSPGVLSDAWALVVDRDLTGLAQLVGGRGPGLTPAGDDLLAGVLVVDALLKPAGREDRAAAARSAETTSVAAAFSRWAAVGQCIRPVHQLLSTMADGRAGNTGGPGREAAARAELRATGASSGPALLLGIDLALAAAVRRSIRRPGSHRHGQPAVSGPGAR